MELMKSRRVLEPIINDMEWEDEKKKPEAEAFAKKYLDIKNTKQTNLITVTAKGRTPEEAQKISQGVVDNFLTLQTDMNQQTQSLLVKFLETRIEEAKKDAEEARTKFAQYQQEHKVYSPDEQAKAIVAKMNAFDEAISNMQVQEKSNQAKLDAINAKLGDIRSSSQNYNINDNENVMNLRKQIVEAQVGLVGLRERYTEEHPSIISAKERIAALQKKLAEEVNTVVASKYTTINPTQAALIGEQANAQVSMAVAKASEDAIQARKAEKEKELEGFPKDVLEYLNLQRDTGIKEQIYTNLIKQAEDNKLKEAMESMDIQIIDAANLPDEDNPSGPRIKLITLIGFIIGGIMSVGYLFLKYR
ncbi:GumC family protein [Selenomonas ruminantium]|uniref:G-rich domain on putative tyrosine kinase n=1 Tax=Selenomonas ruminantium TaxID=971 RepID=A0A1H0PNU0_SELRU|nr:GNVR domain-containing protein [Selenomonas ruminantium]SDP06762.1 G-rich domain on putative tyrosine kinase [Selenomonas ruminantium]